MHRMIQYPSISYDNMHRMIRLHFRVISLTQTERESLKFKLAGAKDYELLESKGVKLLNVVDDNLGSWGHEFVRSLAGEIGQEYGARVLEGADPDSDEAFGDILKMVHTVVPFHINHNAEAEAVDLLIEVQRLKFLLTLDSIDENNYERICLYLVKAADYMADPDDLVVRLLKILTCWSVELCIVLVKNHTSKLTCRISHSHRKCSRRRTRFSKIKDNSSMRSASPCA
jgi:RPN1 N-terminal domain